MNKFERQGAILRLVGERSEPGGEHGALLADRSEECLVECLDDGPGRGADDGVAAEGAAVVAGLESLRRFVGDEQGADRKAVGKPLGERDRVGSDAEFLEREEAARAADAALDLVEDQHRAVLVRD